MNTTGDECEIAIGCQITVLNMSEPGGETQTFEPRPRPDIWVDAVAVKPVGRVRRSALFLGSCQCDSRAGDSLGCGSYFSRMVLVLVITSAYSRNLPKDILSIREPAYFSSWR